MAKVSSKLASAVKCSETFNAEACLHCGTCTAVCPMGCDMLPRKLFRQVQIGREDKMKENIQAIYSCLLCGMCAENCPARVNIADNIRFLRKYINENEFNLS
jgi:heterodisulfide reductase subunit C